MPDHSHVWENDRAGDANGGQLVEESRDGQGAVLAEASNQLDENDKIEVIRPLPE